MAKRSISKTKIKELLKNNKELAIALQKDKAKKEALLIENKSNADIILFSRLNLVTMSENLKNVVKVLDETVSLLKNHSSASSLKFTPRNTISKEEFKEQVKEVPMDCIQEESEPSRKSLNEINTFQKKKQYESRNNKISEVLADTPDKGHNKKNFIKTSKHSSSNARLSIESTEKVCMGFKKRKYSQPISPIKKYVPSSVRTNVTASQADTDATAISKRAVSLDKEAKGKKMPEIISFGSTLQSDTQVLGIQNGAPSQTLQGDETNFISNFEKENKQKNVPAKRYKSLGDAESSSIVCERPRGRSSALKNVSSNVSSRQLDDLSVHMLSSKNLENYETSKSYLQDLTLLKQEILNSAGNTAVTTTEVQKPPDQTEIDKIQLQKECLSKKPIILVRDIMKSEKSKNISSESCELNAIPLEMQLESASSLKMIPEESKDSQSNSAGNCFLFKCKRTYFPEPPVLLKNPKQKKQQKTKLKNSTPPLSFGGEVMGQHEEKKGLRRRSAIVNYKEPLVNMKMRRQETY